VVGWAWAWACLDETSSPTIAVVDAQGVVMDQDQDRQPTATAEEAQNRLAESSRSRIWDSRTRPRRTCCHHGPCYCAPSAEMEMACVSFASDAPSGPRPRPCIALTSSTRHTPQCDRTPSPVALTRRRRFADQRRVSTAPRRRRPPPTASYSPRSRTAHCTSPLPP
jgi:hypothetical protein